MRSTSTTDGITLPVSIFETLLWLMAQRAARRSPVRPARTRRSRSVAARSSLCRPSASGSSIPSEPRPVLQYGHGSRAGHVPPLDVRLDIRMLDQFPADLGAVRPIEHL